MPRQRMLSPKFFTDARVVVLPPLARLLFQGLWCEADREGRLPDEPIDLKIRLLPMDAADVDQMLSSMAGVGLVDRYVVKGRRFLQIRNFLKHQKPHPREPASVLPPMHEAEAAANTPCMTEKVLPGREKVIPSRSESESESESKEVSGEKLQPPPRIRKPKAPPNPRTHPLQLALEADYQRLLGSKYKHAGPSDTQGLKSLLPVADDDQIRLVWQFALPRTEYPQVSTFAQLAQKWPELVARMARGTAPPKGSAIHGQTAWTESDDFLEGLSGVSP